MTIMQTLTSYCQLRSLVFTIIMYNIQPQTPKPCHEIMVSTCSFTFFHNIFLSLSLFLPFVLSPSPFPPFSLFLRLLNAKQLSPGKQTSPSALKRLRQLPPRIMKFESRQVWTFPGQDKQDKMLTWLWSGQTYVVLTESFRSFPLWGITFLGSHQKQVFIPRRDKL